MPSFWFPFLCCAACSGIRKPAPLRNMQQFMRLYRLNQHRRPPYWFSGHADKGPPRCSLEKNFEKKYNDYGVPYAAENCDIDLSQETQYFMARIWTTVPCSRTCASTKTRISTRNTKSSASIPWTAMTPMKSSPPSRLWPIPRTGSNTIACRFASPCQTLPFFQELPRSVPQSSGTTDFSSTEP